MIMLLYLCNAAFYFSSYFSVSISYFLSFLPSLFLSFVLLVRIRNENLSICAFALRHVCPHTGTGNPLQMFL
jgi:hypothetical protein